MRKPKLGPSREASKGQRARALGICGTWHWTRIGEGDTEMSSGGDGNYPRPHAPRKYDSDVLHMRHRDGDSPRSRTGGTDSPRGRSPFGSAAEGPSSSGSAQSDREREEARRREFEKGQKKEVYAPLDPRLLVSGIEVREGAKQWEECQRCRCAFLRKHAR